MVEHWTFTWLYWVLLYETEECFPSYNTFEWTLEKISNSFPDHPVCKIEEGHAWIKWEVKPGTI